MRSLESGEHRLIAASPRLIAPVAHEGTVQPIHSEKYLKILKQRRLESEHTKRSVVLELVTPLTIRPIVQLESTGLSRGLLNQMASGFSNAHSTFGRNMGVRRARVSIISFAPPAVRRRKAWLKPC